MIAFPLLSSLRPEADMREALCRGPQTSPFSLNRALSVAAQGRHLSAPTALSDELRPRPCSRSRPVQARSGAPGWNRTSDTRFRKHAEGVIARSALCAIVLHDPGFCASSVTFRAQPCWAVVRRLVGRMSGATPRPTAPAPQTGLAYRATHRWGTSRGRRSAASAGSEAEALSRGTHAGAGPRGTP